MAAWLLACTPAIGGASRAVDASRPLKLPRALCPTPSSALGAPLAVLAGERAALGGACGARGAARVALGGPQMAIGGARVKQVDPKRADGWPSLSDRNAPYVERFSGNTPNEKLPVLFFLPGIEGSNFSLSFQAEDLATTFNVQWLNIPPEDRSSFADLVELVRDVIDAESSSGGVYLVGESFGACLALFAAASKPGRTPSNLKGMVLINPATSVTESWPSILPTVLDALQTFPETLSDAAYLTLSAPIFALIVGDPLRLSYRRGDEDLPPPQRLLTMLGRMNDQLGQVFTLGSKLPLRTLAFRLSQLIDAAKSSRGLPLRKFTLPVDIVASTDDRVLPSVKEAERLVRLAYALSAAWNRVRLLPNSKVIKLEGSGHVPLMEGQVSLAEVIKKSSLLNRTILPTKDYVSDWKPPSEAELENATKSLANIRKLTSPVFLSTDRSGQRVRGLSALPPLVAADDRSGREGPVLFVGNHQLFGFTDIPLVVEEVYRETSVWVRSLAHPTTFSRRSESDGTDGERARRGSPTGFVDFEMFGAVPVSSRALFKLMSRGDPTLLYPGGVREAFKSTKKGEAYKLFWPPAEESADFARVAARFNATIVPVAAVGAEEAFEMVLDPDDALAVPYFGERLSESAKQVPVGRAGERFVSPITVPKVPGRYYFLFGKPISTAAVDPSDKDACAELYKAVQVELERSIQFLLEKRKDDPYEPALPRVAVEASWDFKEQAPSFPLR